MTEKRHRSTWLRKRFHTQSGTKRRWPGDQINGSESDAAEDNVG